MKSLKETFSFPNRPLVSWEKISSLTLWTESLKKLFYLHIDSKSNNLFFYFFDKIIVNLTLNWMSHMTGEIIGQRHYFSEKHYKVKKKFPAQYDCVKIDIKW